MEAQIHHDESTPEYVVSYDPEDPIFYSTCRPRARRRLCAANAESLVDNAFDGADNGTVAVSTVEDRSNMPEWFFNDRCLDCGSYDANRDESAAGSAKLAGR